MIAATGIFLVPNRRHARHRRLGREQSKNAILRLIMAVLSGIQSGRIQTNTSHPLAHATPRNGGGGESYIAINYVADLQTSREIKYFYELARRKSALNARSRIPAIHYVAFIYQSPDEFKSSVGPVLHTYFAINDGQSGLIAGKKFTRARAKEIKWIFRERPRGKTLNALSLKLKARVFAVWADKER